MKKINFFVLIVLSLLLTVSCSERDINHLKGGFQLKYKDIQASRKSFSNILAADPKDAIARYNFAITQVTDERLAEALLEYDYLTDEISDSVHPSVLFETYFAKAFIKAAQENYEGALRDYQKALSFQPKSLKVKKNIELLSLQQQKQKGKKGKKGDKKGDGDPDGESEGGEGDEENEGSNKPQDEDQRKESEKESLERKNLSEKEVQQILESIKDQEAKVRAREQKGKPNKGKGGKSNAKPW